MTLLKQQIIPLHAGDRITIGCPRSETTGYTEFALYFTPYGEKRFDLKVLSRDQMTVLVLTTEQYSKIRALI